jgi:hypothetical protein
MSEEELTKLLNRLSDIFMLLTGQPEPEQEEEAQKELVPLLRDLISVGNREDLKPQVEELFEIVSKWDTLEKWFSEVEGLSEKMQFVLMNYGIVSEGAPQEEHTEEVQQEVIALEKARQELKKDDSETIDEYEKQIKEMEARMQDLEEKNKKLLELEKKLLESKEKSEVPSSGLKPKLAAPKIKLPPVAAPKKVITPSMMEKDTTADPPEELRSAPPNIQNEAPKIKINIASSASPIKIQPNPVKIDMPSTIQPQIRPSNAPIIKPVGAQTPQIKPVGGPIIKPVSADSPQIKPVGSPIIKPIGAESPQIKPIGGSMIKPVVGGSPQIKPVGNVSISPIGGMGIKPVGDVKRPSISPIASANPEPPKIQGFNPSTPSPGNTIPQPTRGSINLFDQQAGQKKSVNLFDQQPSSKSSPQNDVGVAGEQGRANSGPIQKIGGLGKMDFTAQGPAIVNAENQEYLSMAPNELYQMLIRLENKSFFYDKMLKESEQNYQKGQINEAEFRGARERFNFEIDNAGKKIKDIRALILGLK